MDTLRPSFKNKHKTSVDAMKSFCEFLRQRSPEVFEFADLRSICVFNNFLSITAIMLNIVTIQFKNWNIAPEDDVGVGYWDSLFHLTSGQSNPGCNTDKAFAITVRVCVPRPLSLGLCP